MKAVSFGRDGSERCRPGLQVEGNEEAWPQPVPGTRGDGVHHHRIFGLLYRMGWTTFRRRQLKIQYRFPCINSPSRGPTAFLSLYV